MPSGARSNGGPLRGRRIAHVCAIDLTVRNLLLPQLLALREAGATVHAACAPGESFPQLRELGVRMEPIRIERRISPLADLVTVGQLVRFFRRERIELVHTHTPKAGLLGQLAARLAGVPRVFNTIHGFYFHDGTARAARAFHVQMERIAGRCSTRILSQNVEDVATAVREGICPPARIRTLGNGVDVRRFDPGRFDAAFRLEKRRELDLPAEATVIVTVGRLVREKGYLELLEAFGALAPSRPGLHLAIVGFAEPGKADAVGPETLRRHPQAARIRWLGLRDDVEEVLACGDLFALASWREGLPRSAIEAACMGLPAVATDIRGCRQVVEHGRTGLLVPPRDAGALAEALGRLADDPALRAEMGRRARAKALAEFDERRVIAIVLEEYARAFAGRNGR